MGRRARVALRADAAEHPRVAGPLRRAAGDLVDLVLLFCAMSLTGGPLSPYALLLPAGAALSWHCEGKAAAGRFASGPSWSGGGLRHAGTPADRRRGDLSPLAAAALAAPALVTALEVSGAPRLARRRRRNRAESRSPPPERRSRRVPHRAGTRARRPSGGDPPRPAFAALGHPRLHRPDPGGRAARGSCPNAEYLANLRARSSRQRGSPRRRPGAQPEPPAPAPQNADLVEILGSLATAYRLAHGARIRIEFIAERPQLRSRRIRSRCNPRSATCSTTRSSTLRMPARCGFAPAPPGPRLRRREGHRHGYDSGRESARVRLRVSRRGRRRVRTRGKGLGLAVTKDILEANGGKISQQDQPSAATAGPRIAVLPVPLATIVSSPAPP